MYCYSKKLGLIGAYIYRVLVFDGYLYYLLYSSLQALTFLCYKFPDFVCISSRCKGEMSNKTKEMYLVTEMYELTENGTPLESSFIKPRASSIRSKKDEPVDEQETDLDVEMLAPIPVPSVEGWLQPHRFAAC